MRRGQVLNALMGVSLVGWVTTRQLLSSVTTTSAWYSEEQQQRQVSVSPTAAFDSAINKPCSATVEQQDPFPPNFEVELYSDLYEDDVPEGTTLDYQHFLNVGRSRGWQCSRGQKLREFINHLPSQLSLPSLELGPFCNPLLYGPNVKYFDVLDAAGLKERAERIDYKIVRNVEIDYVSPTGDLNAIKDVDSFSMVVSAHCVEHQLDLVRHLQSVSKLLVDGGYYVMAVGFQRKAGWFLSSVVWNGCLNRISFVVFCCRFQTSAIVLTIFFQRPVLPTS